MATSGYPENEIVGKNCRFLQGAKADPSSADRLRRSIAASKEIEVDLLNYRKDGRTFWNRLLVYPVTEGGYVSYFVASQRDVRLELEELATIARRKADLETEVAHRTAELDASEQSLRFALEAGRLGIWTIDLLTGELSASSECKSICGRAPHDRLTLDELRASIHPDDRHSQ